MGKHKSCKKNKKIKLCIVEGSDAKYGGNTTDAPLYLCDRLRFWSNTFELQGSQGFQGDTGLQNLYILFKFNKI